MQIHIIYCLIIPMHRRYYSVSIYIYISCANFNNFQFDTSTRVSDLSKILRKKYFGIHIPNTLKKVYRICFSVLYDNSLPQVFRIRFLFSFNSYQLYEYHYIVIIFYYYLIG